MKTCRKIFCIALGLVWVSPFVLMILIAFNSNNSTSFEIIFNPATWTLENFSKAWNQADFSRGFFNSTLVTTVSVFLILMITSMAGYALGRFEFRTRKLFIAMMTGSMIVPAVFFSIPLYQLLKILHVDQSLLGLILVEVCGAHVMFVLLFMKHYQNLPDALEESALMDGASPWQIYWKIMFPMARPVIGTVVITQTVWTWNAFLMPLILTLNNLELRTLSVAMYAFQGENIVDWGGMMAAGCIAVIPMLLLFVSFKNCFISGVEGAVKE
ncbi:carbohydrate ABC transporter permease [Faecalibaculum rodentium]|uniref:carbohydrate ABC transporter permease n=1 Tax=Faecalibaculum rodentium TaxID=1702221 RepID=UPI0023F542AC|nr:carbohydrate ABC transporter permease [Faecalibaculum rodentium]